MHAGRDYSMPEVPKSAPRYGNAATRWIGRILLRATGWQTKGSLPDLKQLVIVGAPHTSNWDFVNAMLVNLALGVKFSFLMKQEAFFWPFKGLFMSLGGIPVDRSDTEGIVSQIADWYRNNEHVWLAITPEGTRSKVEKWKTGYLRIAFEAGVPVLLVCWNYPNKTLYLDNVWQPSGDHLADAQAMKDYVDANYTGGNPDEQ